MWFFLATGLCLGLFSFVVLFLQYYIRKGKFRRRPICSIEEWYKKFFEIEGVGLELAKDVCEALSKDIGVHTTQIFPTDRLDKDLTFRQWWGWGRYADELPSFDFWVDHFVAPRCKDLPVRVRSRTVAGLLRELNDLLSPLATTDC